MGSFVAVVVEEANGSYDIQVKERDFSSLPSGDVTIKVSYSSLNYKDALSCSGNKGVTKKYPHTPGIDAAGVVTDSNVENFSFGDEVIVFGYDLGMNHSGGFSQYVTVPKEWVIKKPSNISLKELMIYGTAGFTAALSVDKLVRYGIKTVDGDVIVTGSTGGVGLFAIGILKKLGFNVVAVTGKKGQEEFLKNIGAMDVVGREDVEDTSGKPLLKPRWNAAVDSVGGNILSSIIRSIRYGGAVATCGLAQSPKLDLTVLPFILRGVSLFGIDSVELNRDDKEIILHKIANEYKIDNLEAVYKEVCLEDIKELVPEMLKGNIVGRYLIRID